MTLQLEIVSEHREIVGDDAVRVFREAGGSIGRSLQNDWILPDPDRFISGRHAAIDYKGGIWYLLDTSSNGVYVNNDCEPIGKGNPRRLFNGDRLRMGDFEILVTIDSGESLHMPAPPPPSVAPDHLEEFVPEGSIHSSMQLLDADLITGDDEFQSALFGGTADTGVAAAAEPPPAPKPSKPARAPAVSKALQDAVLADGEMLDALLGGLGISRDDLHPDADVGDIMRSAGEVLREFVEGTTQLLVSRANLKNTFSLDQTTVLPRHNNPIKLSANTKDSIRQLLIGKEGEYLGPKDAVREVCRDLLFHQEAFLDAMGDAFVEFAANFDPDELREGFDATLNSGFLTRFLNKSKYWDLYGEVYPILTDKSGGRFPQMFAEGFVEAYERHVVEYKREGGVEDLLKETVVMTDAKPLTEPAPSPERNAPEPRAVPKVEPDIEPDIESKIEMIGDADATDEVEGLDIEEIEIDDFDLPDFDDPADQAKG
jgi:predicted component of type VI protein secretion system